MYAAPPVLPTTVFARIPDELRIRGRSNRQGRVELFTEYDGEPILKYSVTVGFAHVDIEPGTMVHSHNTEFREFDRDDAHASEFKPVQMPPESERASFQGYVRANGQVGTR